jgi:hypothetical protein
MENGRTKDSIDIYMINTYRWCATKDSSNYQQAKDAYQRVNDKLKGAPIPIAFGEFGCHTGIKVRDWSMVPYLFDEMKDVFSGGFAYSYGEVKQDKSTGFAIFHGGSNSDITGQPSNQATPDYQKLVDQYDDLKIPKDPASWESDKQCQYTPPNPDFKESDWFGTCDSTFKKVQSREGAVCNDQGTTCDVFTPDVIATPEKDICNGNTAFKMSEDPNIDDSSAGSSGSKPSKTNSDTENLAVWVIVGVFGGIIGIILLMLCLRNVFDRYRPTKADTFVALPAMNLPRIPDE